MKTVGGLLCLCSLEGSISQHHSPPHIDRSVSRNLKHLGDATCDIRAHTGKETTVESGVQHIPEKGTKSGQTILIWNPPFSGLSIDAFPQRFLNYPGRSLICREVEIQRTKLKMIDFSYINKLVNG